MWKAMPRRAGMLGLLLALAMAPQAANAAFLGVAGQVMGSFAGHVAQGTPARPPLATPEGKARAAANDPATQGAAPPSRQATAAPQHDAPR